MKVLVTNDDGIAAPGLWALVAGLGGVARVVVAAPDRERSAIGTAITLFQPIRVSEVAPQVPGVAAYAVDGTPADCVVWALNELAGIDMVVSGINDGSNLGDDVLISGTVGAALHAYMYGFPSLAVSADGKDALRFDDAARLAALLARRVNTLGLNVLLNVNLPRVPLASVKGITVSQLARGSHTVTVSRDGQPGRFRLVRQALETDAVVATDVWAVAHGNISITPLHTCLLDRQSPLIDAGSFPGLFAELSASG